MNKMLGVQISPARVAGAMAIMLACVSQFGCGQDEAANAPAVSEGQGGAGPASSARDLAKKRFDETPPAPAPKKR